MQPQLFSAQSESLRKRVPFELRPTNLPGAFTTPPPAQEFDPNRASFATLIKHGVMWRRPQHGDSPYLVRAWNRAFSRNWFGGDRISPVLESRTGQNHALRGLGSNGSGYTSRNWSGGIIQGQWATVVGYWSVPPAELSTEADHRRYECDSACWVGLDGFSSEDALQAGIQRRVDTTGRAQHVAWCEWYVPPRHDSPAYIWQTDVVNFSLAPGNRVYCSVQYIAQKAAGLVYFANDSTGHHFSLTLAPPPGAAAAGDSIEWIAEAPAKGENAGGIPLPPARFTTALGCSADGQTVALPHNGERIHARREEESLSSVELSDDGVTVFFKPLPG